MRAEDADIHAVSLAGGDAVNLPTLAGTALFAPWSSDGGTIAPGSPCVGNWEVRVRPAADSSPRRTTRPGGFDGEPVRPPLR